LLTTPYQQVFLIRYGGTYASTGKARLANTIRFAKTPSAISGAFIPCGVQAAATPLLNGCCRFGCGGGERGRSEHQEAGEDGEGAHFYWAESI